MSVEKKYKPVDLIPFKIRDIGCFIHRDYPKLHPDSDGYLDYWNEEARRIIKGYWGYQQWSTEEEHGVLVSEEQAGRTGFYRWMPPDLYYYTNFGQIKVQKKGSNQEILSFPDLRDVDWLMFYAFTCCDGFSGFKDDTQYTCFRPVGKLQKGEYLSPEEEQLLKGNDEYLRKPNGDYKDYIEAREYLYQDFPKPLGDPLFQNTALNLILLSSRGVGKTYGSISGSVAADFVRSGSATLEEYYNETATTKILLGAIDEKYLNGMIDKLKTAYEYLRTDVGAYRSGSEVFNGFFWKPTMGALAPNDTWTTRVQVEGGGGYMGPNSSITVANYRNNASAGASFRARRIFIDEVGLMDNFADAHRENVASQKRDTKFGYTIYTGTGGNVKKIQEVKEAFYSPEAYEALSYKDIFSGSLADIGLFIPAYYRNSLFKDENGNTDIKKAFEQELFERAKRKKKDAKSYRGYCTSFPIVPKEMFLADDVNIFPTDRAENRIAYGELNQRWKSWYTLVDIRYSNKEKTRAVYTVKEQDYSKAILRWGDEKDRKGKDLEGEFVIFEPPSLEDNSYPPKYLTIYDPVKDETGSSLAVATVFKMWDFGGQISYNIVAEWIGRHKSMPENHERAFKLAALYGCKLFPEINLEDILRHARTTKRLGMLEDRPGSVLDKITTQKKNYAKGLYLSPGMKSKCLTYLNEVLITPTAKVLKDDKLESVLMIDECKSMRFLEEVIFFSAEGNYDYISAMLLIGVWVRQFLELDSLRDYNKANETRFQELRDMSLGRKNIQKIDSGVGFRY